MKKAKTAEPTITRDLTPERAACPYCGRPMWADYYGGVKDTHYSPCVRVLRHARGATDQQRPGAGVREPPVSRAPGHRAQGRQPVAGAAGRGQVDRRAGDPVTRGDGGRPSRCGSGRVEAVAGRIGDPAGAAGRAEAIPARPRRVPESPRKQAHPVTFAGLAFLNVLLFVNPRFVNSYPRVRPRLRRRARRRREGSGTHRASPCEAGGNLNLNRLGRESVPIPQAVARIRLPCAV